MPPLPNKYQVFISYSSKDKACAQKLHKKLKNYRIPRALVGRPGRDGPVPRRISPFFCEHNEPHRQNLNTAIQDDIRSAQYLIVICSPHAAASKRVNEEILYFKSLGREDRILAIILDGVPNTEGVQECFPLALKHKIQTKGTLNLSTHIEPIGGDLRKGGDGWKNCLLKAIAGITSMGYNTFVKREKKRDAVRITVLTVLGSIILGCAVVWWDYTRTKVHYYAHLTSRWGIPVGAVKLTVKDLHQRQFSYKIESSRGKVRRVSYINSIQQLRDEQDNFDASIQEIYYDEKGDIQQITFRNHNDKITCRKEFSLLKESDHGRVHYVELKVQNKRISTSTDNLSVSVHRIQYRPDGLVASQHFLNAYRTPISNTEGVFGVSFEYGDLHLPVKKTYLDHYGKPQINNHGVTKIEVTRDAKGNPTELIYLGTNGNPVLNKNGYHKSISTFDNHGKIIETAYYGLTENTISIAD